MKIKISEIRQLLESILITHGSSSKDAVIIADEYLEGELCGRYSHGLMAFPSIVPKISGNKQQIKILKQTKALIYIDANNNPGAVVGEQALHLIAKIVKEEGVGLVLIRNMMTWLRPGTMAKKIVERGWIGFVMNGGGKPMVAPPGGYDPVIATNPLGIGIPTDKDPVIVDMATSKKAWGEVRIAEKLGKELPPDMFYDKNGKFAVSPKDAYSVVPAGDYKGFALGLFIEILTGSLLDMPMGSHKVQGDYRTQSRGACMIIIDPKISTDVKKFKEANSKLIKEVKDSHKLPKVQEILIPGERALKKKRENLKNGYLEISEDLWKELHNL